MILTVLQLLSLIPTAVGSRFTTNTRNPAHKGSSNRTPYRRLLNQLLKRALQNEAETESRLDRLERELDRLKRRLVA